MSKTICEHADCPNRARWTLFAADVDANVIGYSCDDHLGVMCRYSGPEDVMLRRLIEVDGPKILAEAEGEKADAVAERMTDERLEEIRGMLNNREILTTVKLRYLGIDLLREVDRARAAEVEVQNHEDEESCAFCRGSQRDAQLAACVEALGPFAETKFGWFAKDDMHVLYRDSDDSLTVGDFRRAADALAAVDALGKKEGG